LSAVGAKIDWRQVVWGGVSPPYWWSGLRRWHRPFPDFFLPILDLKMATLGAFWALFFYSLRRHRGVGCGMV